MGLTGGIIDATDYLDQNAYANDDHPFYGAEIGYRLTIAAGEGDYRVIFDGGNTGLQRVQVAAAYCRRVMNRHFALTGKRLVG
ncbi:MAG: hypothetical protein V2I40_01505 [Desulfobacteraceae bacterium]|jgi:hypothetical protein|nr:hypothetical protein [Desulfobacteraceae bacterium]